jgi:hypothetical protein
MIESFMSADGSLEFSAFHFGVGGWFSARDFEVVVLEDGFRLAPEGRDDGVVNGDSVELFLDFDVVGNAPLASSSLSMQPVYWDSLVAGSGSSVVVDLDADPCAGSDRDCEPIVELRVFETLHESERWDMASIEMGGVLELASSLALSLQSVQRRGHADFPEVDVRLSIVPEPGTSALLLLGLGLTVAAGRGQD